MHICVHQELKVQHKENKDFNKYWFQTGVFQETLHSVVPLPASEFCTIQWEKHVSFIQTGKLRFCAGKKSHVPIVFYSFFTCVRTSYCPLMANFPILSFINSSLEAFVYCNTCSSWDFNILFFLSVIAIRNRNGFFPKKLEMVAICRFQTRHK